MEERTGMGAYMSRYPVYDSRTNDIRHSSSGSKRKRHTNRRVTESSGNTGAGGVYVVGSAEHNAATRTTGYDILPKWYPFLILFLSAAILIAATVVGINY